MYSIIHLYVCMLFFEKFTTLRLQVIFDFVRLFHRSFAHTFDKITEYTYIAPFTLTLKANVIPRTIYSPFQCHTIRFANFVTIRISKYFKRKQDENMKLRRCQQHFHYRTNRPPPPPPYPKQWFSTCCTIDCI